MVDVTRVPNCLVLALTLGVLLALALALDWHLFVIAYDIVRLLWLGDMGFSRVDVLWQGLLAEAEAAVFSLFHFPCRGFCPLSFHFPCRGLCPFSLSLSLFTSLAGARCSLLTPLAGAAVSSPSSFTRTGTTGCTVWSRGSSTVWSGRLGSPSGCV